MKRRLSIYKWLSKYACCHSNIMNHQLSRHLSQLDTQKVQYPVGCHQTTCPSEDMSSRESSKQMSLGGQSDTQEVQYPAGSHQTTCPSEDMSRRESSKQMPFGGQLDTHVVHFMKEGRQKDSFWIYQVRHPRGAFFERRSSKRLILKLYS